MKQNHRNYLSFILGKYWEFVHVRYSRNQLIEQSVNFSYLSFRESFEWHHCYILNTFLCTFTIIIFLIIIRHYCIVVVKKSSKINYEINKYKRILLHNVLYAYVTLSIIQSMTFTIKASEMCDIFKIINVIMSRNIFSIYFKSLLKYVRVSTMFTLQSKSIRSGDHPYF